MSNRTLLGALVFGGLGLALSSPAWALTLSTPTTLDQLVGTGNNIVDGDKSFDNFTYASTGPGAPTASQVSVQSASSIGLPNPGTVFTAAWNSLSGAQNSLITYQAHVVGGTLSITGVNLTFDGKVVQNPPALATVTETVMDLNGKVLGTLSVTSTGSALDNQSASLTLDPGVRDVLVYKNIQVAPKFSADGSSFTGIATISVVENTFTQGGSGGPPPIPEPASLALLPLALAGLGLRKKLA